MLSWSISRTPGILDVGFLDVGFLDVGILDVGFLDVGFLDVPVYLKRRDGNSEASVCGRKQLATNSSI